MGLYKQKFNTRTGQFNLVPTNQALTWRAAVASQANLPLSGNVLYDARMVNDTQHLYIWSIESTTGLLTDWVDQGDIIDLTWDAISGKPSSTPTQLDQAVTNSHTHSNKTEIDKVTDGDHDVRIDNPHAVSKSQVGLNNVPDLDTTDAVNNQHTHSNKVTLDAIQEAFTTTLKNKLDGIEASAVALTTVKLDSDISDALSKKHSANNDSDIGFLKVTANGGIDEVKIGAGKVRFPDGIVVSISETVDTLDNQPGNQPQKLYVDSTGYHAINQGTPTPDGAVLIAEVTCVGDTNPVIVDKRAFLNNFTYDTATLDVDATKRLKVKDNVFDSNGAASSAVGAHEMAYDHSELHTQGTDQGLDTGGANAVTAAQAKAGYTHSGVVSGNPHSVTKTEVGLSNVENLKVKLDATAAPSVNDDVDLGYAVGSRWVDVTNDKEYVCLDATEDNAVWTETTQSGGGTVTRGTFANGDLVAGVLTITHSKGLSAPYPVIVFIFDNNNKKIMPDEITGAADTVLIDLTSYGAITGTWGYAYMA